MEILNLNAQSRRNIHLPQLLNVDILGRLDTIFACVSYDCPFYGYREAGGPTP